MYIYIYVDVSYTYKKHENVHKWTSKDGCTGSAVAEAHGLDRKLDARPRVLLVVVARLRGVWGFRLWRVESTRVALSCVHVYCL